jgi:phosphatidate cytidylyltransferase
LLAQRVASAAIGVPIILLLVFLGGAWYTAVLAAALAVASIEFQHALGRPWLDPISVLIALLVAGIAVGAHMGRTEWYIWLGVGLALPPLVVGINPTGEGAAADALWTAGGVTYIGFLGSFMVLLRDEFDGRSWVYLALLSTFAVDTAAFFVGRAIGRHKLAPRISPKKTVEGFIGGCVFGYGAVLLLNYAFDLGVAPATIVILALLLPLMATAGDLAESAMKRAMKIKDTSELIPGHGGVLDRLDSVLFTFTLVYLFTQWAL